PCDQTLQRSLNAFEVALKQYFQQSSANTKEQDLAHFNEVFLKLLTRLPSSQAALGRELEQHRSVYAAILGHRSLGSVYERLSPKDRFGRTLSAIAAWIRAESALQPVILHVEDAQWADGDTLRAVQSIARLGRNNESGVQRLVPGLPVVILSTS